MTRLSRQRRTVEGDLRAMRRSIARTCRKIEPVIRRSPEGWLIEQSCGNCGLGIEKTPRSWRHII